MEMSLMKLRSMLLCLAALAIGWCAIARAADADRVVVMISVDGLAHYYIDDPKADMPTIRALAREGGRAESMKVSAPSVTWPNHTTLVTGVHPAKHGVVGNNFFDRAAGKPVVLIGDPVYDKDEIVKVPTLYDLAHDAGMKTIAIRWPATRNAKSLDWMVPDCIDVDFIKRHTTPALLAQCEQRGLWYRTEKNGDRVSIEYKSGDETSTEIFISLLREQRPRLGLLHIPNVDHSQHLSGPKSPEAYAAIQHADGLVKLVWEELKRDFPGHATLIVTSDHGFSPIAHAVFPNVTLRKAGLLDVKGMRIVDAKVQLVPQGGCAMLYITDEKNRDEIVRKVRDAFASAKGVSKVVGPDELSAYGFADPAKNPRSPDMVLFAEMGYIFGDTAAGALEFAEKPERRGSHGHDPNFPELHGTFVAWGSGIRAGSRAGVIGNIDVAPTIAALLGLKIPNPDGKPVAAVLAE